MLVRISGPVAVLLVLELSGCGREVGADGVGPAGSGAEAALELLGAPGAPGGGIIGGGGGIG
jgi:hypothetical protein